MQIAPLVESWWAIGLIVAAGYALCLSLSGPIVRFFVSLPDELANSRKGMRFDIGALIGKCENILTITFVLAGAETGLALIFAAKSLVRREDEVMQ